MSKSSSEIPNLLDSFHSARASRGGRIASLTRRHDGQSSGDRNDHVIQRTDDDAAGSRLSAVQAGYLNDDFAAAMWEGSGNAAAPRRMPIINRGTYVRTMALDAQVDRFLVAYPDAGVVQVLSLGAGTDTRYFRLMQKQPSLRKRMRYHEIDFAVATRKKIQIIEKTPGLMELLGDPDHEKESADQCMKDGGLGNKKLNNENENDTMIEENESIFHTRHQGRINLSISKDKTSLMSASYFLHPLDLRSLASSNAPPIPNLIPSAPTLILSECCLTYLSASLSTTILRYITQSLLRPLNSPTVILYEPLHPTDAFGRTMLSNLSSRGIIMPGLEAFPSLNAHGERLKEVGLDGWEGSTVKEIWDRQVVQSEKLRLRSVEMIDEEEEWALLAGHYGIVRGWRR